MDDIILFRLLKGTSNVGEMKRQVEMQSLGVTEIKHGVLKSIQKKDKRHLDFCGQSKPLCLVAFVNFLYMYGCTIYHFDPFLHGDDTINPLTLSPGWSSSQRERTKEGSRLPSSRLPAVRRASTHRQ